MSNYIANSVRVNGIGRDYRNKRFSLSMKDNFADVSVSNDDVICFESRNKPPLGVLSRLSKQCYPGQEMCLTYVDEGSSVISRQMRLKDGMITGHRQRYDDGFDEPDPYPEWTAVSKEESNKMLFRFSHTDRVAMAEALCGGIQSEDMATYQLGHL